MEREKKGGREQSGREGKAGRQAGISLTEYKLINVEGIMRVRNHHLVDIRVKIFIRQEAEVDIKIMGELLIKKHTDI